MMWALKNNERVRATPKGTAICNKCNEELIAKCGSIKIWHWSHRSNKNCDDWYEPESQWHLNWKNEFPKEYQEVVIEKGYTEEDGYKEIFESNDFTGNYKSHIADIKTTKWVIELQNSSISTEEIQEREKFYGNMIWLLNGEKLCGGLELRKKENIYTFRFRNAPKSWGVVNKSIYIHLIGKMGRKISREELIDIDYRYFSKTYISYNQIWDGTKIFLIKKLYFSKYCGGWGIILSKKEFLEKFKEEVKNGNCTKNIAE